MEGQPTEGTIKSKLLAERLDLNERIEKLEAIERDDAKWIMIPKTQQQFMRIQKFAMLAYSQALDERIHWFECHEVEDYENHKP